MGKGEFWNFSQKSRGEVYSRPKSSMMFWAYHHLVVLQGKKVMDICLLYRYIYWYSVYLIQNVKKTCTRILTMHYLQLIKKSLNKSSDQKPLHCDFLAWFCSYTSHYYIRKKELHYLMELNICDHKQFLKDVVVSKT